MTSQSVALRPIALLIGALLVSGCGNGFAEIDRQPSPDERMVAIVEYSDPGACCSDWSRVSFTAIDSEGNADDLGEYVTVSRSRVAVRWIDNGTVLIEACGASHIEAKSNRIVGSEDAAASRRIFLATVPSRAPDGSMVCDDMVMN